MSTQAICGIRDTLNANARIVPTGAISCHQNKLSLSQGHSGLSLPAKRVSRAAFPESRQWKGWRNSLGIAVLSEQSLFFHRAANCPRLQKGTFPIPDTVLTLTLVPCQKRNGTGKCALVSFSTDAVWAVCSRFHPASVFLPLFTYLFSLSFQWMPRFRRPLGVPA